jgi:hypothetical protein
MQYLAPIKFVQANFFIERDYPHIVGSPVHAAPYVYVNPTVTLEFDYNVPRNHTQINNFSYSLDGKTNATLNSSKKYSTYYCTYSFFKTLDNLTNDNHTLTIFAYYLNGTTTQIYNADFIVDTNFIPPIPILISPLNHTTYNSKQVPLIYTINSQVLWSYYSLDASEYSSKPFESEWKGFTGNITLPELSEGTHRLKIQVTTSSQELTTYTDSLQIIYFTINTKSGNGITPPSLPPNITPAPDNSPSTPSATPTQTASINPTESNFRLDSFTQSIIFVTIMAVASLLIVLYFRLIKKSYSQTKQSLL